MAKKVFSCCLTGLACQIVEVESDISNGLPVFNIVGLGDTSVQESKERVRSGIKNSGAEFPQTRKIVNLAPAEIKKQGSLFDLPIAISILISSGQIDAKNFEHSILIGELSLDGGVKKIHGTLAIVQHIKTLGFKKIFLPAQNAKEASFIEGIEVFGVNHLRELIAYSSNPNSLKSFPSQSLERIFQGLKSQNRGFSFDRIIGLGRAKRALSIAAAGGRNFLLIGPPGTGKTILARAFSDIVPEMSTKEIFETTKIFSIAGMLDDEMPLILKRPFREVHHTASLVSVIGGGGINPRPGEISLAHNGVLFFDEITEFPSYILEAMRQPLEDKNINISRAKFSVRFPANFMFVATMNPCPCGYKGDSKVRCICSPAQIKSYQRKLSGPIRDRFDIVMDVPLIPMRNIFSGDVNSETETLCNEISAAKNLQTKRFNEISSVSQNSEMTIDEIRQFCELKKEDEIYLNNGSDNYSFSNRAYLKILKIARTIADMDNCEKIEHSHLAEALQYRITEEKPSK